LVFIGFFISDLRPKEHIPNFLYAEEENHFDLGRCGTKNALKTTSSRNGVTSRRFTGIKDIYVQGKTGRPAEEEPAGWLYD
jgi:hypothetical protein